MIIVSEKEQQSITEKFSLHLAELRTALNLSQTEFGKLVGISRQQLSLLERRKGKVSWVRFNSMLLPLLANEATRKMMLDYGIVSENFLEQIRGEQQTADAEVF